MAEKQEKDIQELLKRGKIFYKFTKSNESQAKLYSEAFFKKYPENSIIKADGYHGLSFCDDISKLLTCIGYGDTLTQIIIDEESDYFCDIEEFLYKEKSEYSKFGEYTAFTVQTGKNYSLKDPTILNEIIQYATEDNISQLFRNQNDYGEDLKTIYKKIGFEESAIFLEKLEENLAEYNPYYRGNPRVHLKKIKEISSELIKDYECKFSFKKAEEEYNCIKENVVDRRREPVEIIKNNEDYIGIADAVAYYLHSNHFTVNQSKEIVKIMFAANKMDKNSINVILPKFSTSFTNEQLNDIKKFAFKKPNTKEFIEYIDDVFNDKIPITKPTLIEKINAKASQFKLENKNYQLKYSLDKINNRYER